MMFEEDVTSFVNESELRVGLRGGDDRKCSSSADEEERDRVFVESETEGEDGGDDEDEGFEVGEEAVEEEKDEEGGE